MSSLPSGNPQVVTDAGELVVLNRGSIVPRSQKNRGGPCSRRNSILLCRCKLNRVSLLDLIPELIAHDLEADLLDRTRLLARSNKRGHMRLADCEDCKAPTTKYAVDSFGHVSRL